MKKQEARFGDGVIEATVPDGLRNQLVNDTWDSTAVVLEAGAAIEATAKAAVRRGVLIVAIENRPPWEALAAVPCSRRGD